MTLFVELPKTGKLHHPSPKRYYTPETFVSELLKQPTHEQTNFLAQHLFNLSQTKQDKSAELLKQQADRFMRTDLERCLQVANLIKVMADLTNNNLFLALSLRAEGNAYTLGHGDYQKGVACYDQAAEIYGRFGQKLNQAWSQNGKIYALANLGRYDEAFAVGEWASRIFRELEEWLPLADLTVNLAIINGRLSQDTKALHLLDQAREFYKLLDKDVTEQLLVVDINRAILLRNLGQFQEAITVNQAVLTSYLSQGNVVGAASAQQNLAMTYFILGRYNETLTLLDQAQEGFRQDGRYRYAMLVELFTSDCLLHLRRFTIALEKCHRARQLFAELGTPFEIGKCILNEAHAYIGLTRYDEALVSLMEARDLFEQEGNRSAMADTDLTISSVLLQQNQANEALVLAQLAGDVFRAYDFPLGQARAHLLAAQCFLKLGQLEQASTSIANLLQNATTHNLPTLIHKGHHLQGILAIHQGESDEAIAAWHDGIEALELVCSRLMLEYRAEFTEDKMQLYEDIVDLYVDAPPIYRSAILCRTRKISGFARFVSLSPRFTH